MKIIPFKEQILKTWLFLIFYLHYKTHYVHLVQSLYRESKWSQSNFPVFFFIIICWWRCRIAIANLVTAFACACIQYSILMHQSQSLKILDPKIFSVSTQIRCNKQFHPQVCIVAPHYLKKGHNPCLSSLSEHHPSDVSLLSGILKEETNAWRNQFKQHAFNMP